MLRNKQNWMRVALLAVPLAGLLPAQQYPPPQQQQQPYPAQQGQYPQQQPPPQGQYPPQQGQYPPQQGQYPPQQGAYDPQQAYNPPATNFPPDQLDQMVSRIALYPDPLLAQVFAASTFPDQIQPAAQWADQHHYLSGQDLANAIQNDQLGFDPSVEALLPFPSVLQMMASDMNWTATLGNAFMSQGAQLQDSVQRMRSLAYNNGYLKSNNQIVVTNNGPWTEIAPYNPGYIVVPYYDPAVVYYRPYRAGFGISFGYGVGIGTFFSPWGWGGNRFAWDRHEVFVGNRVWDRRVIIDRHAGYRPGSVYAGRPVMRPEQRGVYSPRPGPTMRPEAGRGPVVAGPREGHPLENRSNNERRAAERGRPAPRENHGREERRHN